MSREIKFRAWDGERLREVNSIGWVDGELDWIDTPKYNGPIDEDVKIMQYTGLKDKNGVEIYEGDILDFTLEQHYDGIYQEMNYKQPIVFSKGSFWAGNNLLHAVICADEELRVIGSIYEKPELLENN